MSHWSITKSFEFCYGHRVHTQVVNPQLADDTRCACRHLHGHQGRVDVTLTSLVLENAMVLDFRNLEFLKHIIDRVFDHKMVLDTNDPLIRDLVPTPPASYASCIPIVPLPLLASLHVNASHVLPTLIHLMGSPAQQEMLEGLVFVPFVPTSENFAKFIYDIVVAKLNQVFAPDADNPHPFYVSSVTFHETPKSYSTYYA